MSIENPEANIAWSPRIEDHPDWTKQLPVIEYHLPNGIDYSMGKFEVVLEPTVVPEVAMAQVDHEISSIRSIDFTQSELSSITQTVPEQLFNMDLVIQYNNVDIDEQGNLVGFITPEGESLHNFTTAARDLLSFIKQQGGGASIDLHVRNYEGQRSISPVLRVTEPFVYETGEGANAARLEFVQDSSFFIDPEGNTHYLIPIQGIANSSMRVLVVTPELQQAFQQEYAQSSQPINTVLPEVGKTIFVQTDGHVIQAVGKEQADIFVSFHISSTQANIRELPSTQGNKIGVANQNQIVLNQAEYVQLLDPSIQIDPSLPYVATPAATPQDQWYAVWLNSDTQQVGYVNAGVAGDIQTRGSGPATPGAPITLDAEIGLPAELSVQPALTQRAQESNPNLDGFTILVTEQLPDVNGWARFLAVTGSGDNAQVLTVHVWSEYEATGRVIHDCVPGEDGWIQPGVTYEMIASYDTDNGTPGEAVPGTQMVYSSWLNC